MWWTRKILCKHSSGGEDQSWSTFIFIALRSYLTNISYNFFVFVCEVVDLGEILEFHISILYFVGEQQISWNGKIDGSIFCSLFLMARIWYTNIQKLVSFSLFGLIQQTICFAVSWAYKSYITFSVCKTKKK